MRQWQTKVDNSAPAATGLLRAAEDNARGNELSNIVSSAGLTLDPYNAGSDSDLNMLAKAVACYGAGGAEFGVDSGGVNAYVVNTPLNFKVVTPHFRGRSIRFYAGATNTGPATLNAWGLGAKTLYSHISTALIGGEIVSGVLCEAIFDPALDGGAGAWRLAPWANMLMYSGYAPENPLNDFLNRVIFDYTGADQTFVVPAGITTLRVKAWGAAGGWTSGSNAPGGPGGYTSADLTVTPGDTYKVMVGKGGRFCTTADNIVSQEYGNGGLGAGQTYSFPTSMNDEWGTGGGLAGLFLTSVSQANAKVIAGGGGGANDDETVPHLGGEPGNGSGGQTGMAGQNAGLIYNLSNGGGGAGYNGGNTDYAAGQRAKGGTGYVTPTGSASANIQSAAQDSVYPPNTSDVDHGGVAGVASPIPGNTSHNNHGRVVIRY